MSTPSPAAPVPPQAPSPTRGVVAPGQDEIRIVSHSNLFYWWPVWAVGFLMAALTAFDGHRLILVPSDAKVKRDIGVSEVDPSGAGTTRTVLREGILLKTGHLLPDKPDRPGGELPDPDEPRLHMAANSGYGVIFATVLLLVIVITNVPLRGLWSWIVIIFVILLSVIFALAGWWNSIFYYLSVLDIRINMAGYLVISGVLFVAWLVTMLVFDRQIYMVFQSGQFRVCEEVGGGETAYDTQGMVVQKQRADLFRHVILGLGSGDLIVRTTGANAHEFHLPNVLFVGHKLKMIEDMQREKAVVRG
jgi:hypothetical protein